ncbi:hypothetical protein MASR1M31_04670 [Porphyromonadaceae bacterium]
MAKLKDDQIRWILSVDASGVQKEYQTLISRNNDLAAANRKMTSEMREAEKQMRAAEKEMERLERSFQTSSDGYAQAKGTFESAKAEIADYSSKIAANVKAQESNSKAADQMVKSMSLSDMTMSQLRQRASELQRQLNNTSASTDPDSYRKLQDELGQVRNRMSEVTNTNTSLIDQFAGMNNPVGTAARSVQGFSTALKALIANPVGIVIMAIVAAFYALKTAIAGSDEASTRLEGVMNALSSSFDSFKRVVTESVALLYNFFRMDFSAMKENANVIAGITTNMLGNAKAAYEAALAEDALNDSIARNNDISEVNKSRIDELRLITQDSTKSVLERKRASEELLRLENENYRMSVENISGQYRIFEEKNKNLIDAIKRGSADQYAEVNNYMRMVQDGTELTFQQRTELANLVNQITTSLDEGTEEQKEKFRSFFSDMSKSQQTFFTESRRDRRRESQIAAAEAKEAREKQLNIIDQSLNEETNKLAKSRLNGEITEKQFNARVEQLTIDSIHKKLAVRGLEKEKILALQRQLIDAQLKLQQESDSSLMETITKTRDQQIAAAEVVKNNQLATLQEQISDQKIYALRASEVETSFAEMRASILRSFSETIKNTEFSNAQTAADAITQNESLIIEADAQILAKRDAQRRLFAKTTAEFERQYGLQTWESRKAQEEALLTAQYEKNLLSEETYQAALRAIEQKYADEKTNIRQQYGIASMAEIYNTELAALESQHEAGLLSEEEFEKAKLNLKLEYASRYAQQAQQLTGMASNAISALMQAETASVEAEYEARIAAAGDNAEEIERLENEKAEKKLEIEKKYADVQFAVKVSEIISSTALAIMQAWAQLGPIGGPIAAALIGITGAAQIAAANAEREKVKNMTLRNPGGSKKTGSVRLRTGFAEGGFNIDPNDPSNSPLNGGFTPQGPKYQIAGWLPVHSGEYIVASDELRHPDVVQKVRSIEAIRRQRTSKNAVPGFADGGFNSPDSTSPAAYTPSAINERLLAILEKLDRDGLPAYLLLSEFEDKLSLRDRSRSIASKS